MKKLIIISAMAAGGLFYNTANAQIRFHIGIRLFPHVYVQPAAVDVQPAPVVYANDGEADYNADDDYYYLPDLGAYYNVNEQCYYYFDGDNWISAAYLPGYQDYDWRNARRFEVRAPRPYLHDDIYRARFHGAEGNWAHNADHFRRDDHSYNAYQGDNSHNFDNRGGGDGQRFNNRGQGGYELQNMNNRGGEQFGQNQNNTARQFGQQNRGGQQFGQDQNRGGGNYGGGQQSGQNGNRGGQQFGQDQNRGGNYGGGQQSGQNENRGGNNNRQNGNNQNTNHSDSHINDQQQHFAQNTRAYDGHRRF